MSIGHEIYELLKDNLPADSTLTEEKFCYFYDHLITPAHRATYYKHFSILKCDATFRWIEEPVDSLKEIQRALIPIFQKFPFNNWAFGLGGKKYSSVQHGCDHAGANVIVKMDIKHFFPSVDFQKYLLALASSNSPSYYSSLAPLIFNCANKLPTGAPTSTLVSSIAFTPIENQLMCLASYNGLFYTRYIDDLTFSGKTYPQGFQREVVKIVRDHGFNINHQKSRVLYRANQSQVVTGVGLNTTQPRVPRAYSRTLRVELDYCARDKKSLDPVLIGKLNYVKQVDPNQYNYFISYFEKRKERWSQLAT